MEIPLPKLREHLKTCKKYVSVLYNLLPDIHNVGMHLQVTIMLLMRTLYRLWT